MIRRLIILLLIVGCVFAREYIAIIDFEGISVSEADAKALTQRLTSEMITLELYQVLERSEMKRLLDEQKFQYSGCVDVSCAVEIGKLLGAKSMVVGTISKLGDAYSVDSRLIDVKTGENYVSANYTTTKDLGDVLNGMRNIAYKICEMEVPENLILKDSLNFDSLKKINDKHKKLGLSPEELEKLELKRPPSEFSDGPPCIESLTQNKLTDGRDRVLYQYIQYAKRKWPEEWTKHINAFNYKYFDPPLEDRIIQEKINPGKIFIGPLDSKETTFLNQYCKKGVIFFSFSSKKDLAKECVFLINFFPENELKTLFNNFPSGSKIALLYPENTYGYTINLLIDEIANQSDSVIINRASYNENLTNVREAIKELGKYELRKYELNRQKQILATKKDEQSKKRLKKLKIIKLQKVLCSSIL